MVGITRFYITDKITGPGAWRFERARECWPMANKLYRQIYQEIDMPLLPGEEVIKCTKTEFMAGYDYQLGIDIIFRHQNLTQSTQQEKLLGTDWTTLTVEHMQDWLTGELGDWFNFKGQYYFVGYNLDYQQDEIKPWMLVNWVQLKIATAQRRINWHLQQNKEDGARASFIWAQFNDIPDDVIILTSVKPKMLLIK